MSLTLNMVGGGRSGGLKATDAVLAAIAPTGSAVTMTKGSVTLTPTIWTTDADNTLDVAIFSVPASTFDANDWTVTATLNGETASRTIIIDSAKEYETELVYPLYLYHNGVNNGITSQKVYGSTGTVSLTNSNNILTCYNNYSSGQYGITGYYGTSSSSVDVTKYRYLVATVTEVTLTANMQSRFGVINSVSGEMSSWSFAAVKVFSSAVNEETTFTLDISSITGSKRIGFGSFTGSGTRTAYIKIKDLYLTI